MSQCAPKNNSDQHTAVRETGVSRHHGGPIEGPPETRRTSLHYRMEWFKKRLTHRTPPQRNIGLRLLSWPRRRWGPQGTPRIWEAPRGTPWIWGAPWGTPRVFGVGEGRGPGRGPGGRGALFCRTRLASRRNWRCEKGIKLCKVLSMWEETINKIDFGV